MSITYELNSQSFTALNGGPVFNFTPAISFFVSCENQDEVDDYCVKLSEGGEEGQCGWLQDKFGVSWQIVPDNLGELLSDPDPIKAQKVMSAMLQMRKLDIEKLKQAREEK